MLVFPKGSDIVPEILLPAPERPMMPKISPFSMEKLMFLAASTVPPLVLKRLQRFSTCIIGSIYIISPCPLINILNLNYSASSAAASVVSASASAVSSLASSAASSVSSAESSNGTTAPSIFLVDESL